MSQFDLDGKVAIITGSSRGIGKAIAESFAAHGAKVMISSRKLAACELVASDLNARFGAGTACAVEGPISSKDKLQRMVDETRRAFGKIDILVCNAASNPYYGPMSGITDELFSKVLANNIISNHWLIQMVAPEMIARRNGAIIVVSSTGGMRGSSTIGAYNISKAADFQLVRNLAIEWGQHNIRVNSIAPGVIRTAFARALWEDPIAEQALNRFTPLGRIGEPHEISGAAVFLASDASRFMTGQVMVVDGGVAIKGGAMSKTGAIGLEQGSTMVEVQIHEGVLEILLNNPPVNALGSGVRQGLIAAVAAAQSDDAVQAIVIRGAGRLFCAGADITEFDKPVVYPMLPQVIDAIEASVKPVVAAIHGMALGGGLEIALGCHFRVSASSAKLGLPEVKLGILPGAGGTQRLPRIVGIEASLAMIVSGDPITASKAVDIGLIDKLVDDGQLATEALSYARTLKSVRRTGDRRVAADPSAFERFEIANARIIKGLDAPAACIEAVHAAAEMPLAEGQAKESALFMRLVHGDQSKAFRHVFFAERAAASIEGLPKTAARRPVRAVGIIGAGTMGGGIAMNFLSSGIPVTLLDMNQEALDRGVDTVRRNYEASAAKGRLEAAQVDEAMAHLTPTMDLAQFKDCDLIIEAVYENMDLKKSIFARVDEIAKPGAVLASNTSYLSIDEIALATNRPQDVLGLHFFSPANVMKLVEVVRGARTAPDVLATGMNVAKQIGKVPVVAGVCYGFIGNRMLIPRYEQAFRLLNEGALPEQVDRVDTAFGMPMGPFRMADLSGIDLGWHRDPSRVENVRDALCAIGRWGQKTKAGFYDYDEKREAKPSPVVAEIIHEFRKRGGTSPRSISDEEILVRTIYTMINVGAKIVEEGIAQRASDVDIVWIYGYGWPRHKGGPMFWADQVGSRTIVEALKKYQKELGPDFVIAPLLHRSANEEVALSDIRP